MLTQARTTLRVLALLILLAGCMDLLSNLIPRNAQMPDLLDDVRSGRTSVVQVFYASPLEVRARWSTGFAGDRELTYRFETFPAGEGSEAEFEKLVRGELGSAAEVAGAVTFERQDPRSAMGGLSLLVPVLYWRLISWAWLQWAVLLVCAVVLLDIVLRSRQRASGAGYWLTACVVFGAGFPAYLWSEPSPLYRRPGPNPAGGMTGWAVIGGTALWSGLTVLIAATMTWLR